MKKYFFLISTILILFAFIFNGCKKDEELKYPPTISFKTGTGYTQDGAIVQVGHKLFFGIHAEGISEVITNFTIKKVLDNGTIMTVMDTGLYSSTLDINETFYQNVEDKATWTFSVMDRNHMSAQITMVVYKDPNSTFGGIFYYPSITLGFQHNTSYGHFLDPSTGIVYMNDSATANQSKVNILCYYDTITIPNTPVLSSAGEMDNFSTDAQTYYPCIVGWTTRNYTKWDISVDTSPIPIDAFNAAQNDSLLLVSYHEVWGKKKFKYATTGKIIPFKTAAGKLGLIRVIYADGTDSGKMNIAIKIQQ